jgi:hypothetical protein
VSEFLAFTFMPFCQSSVGAGIWVVVPKLSTLSVVVDDPFAEVIEYSRMFPAIVALAIIGSLSDSGWERVGAAKAAV